MNAPNGTTVYEGAFEYLNGTLQRIALEEGQLIRDASGNYTAQYYLKDHLGSVRQVISETGAVLQETEYYPFGLPVVRNGGANNKYLYNGKETQPNTGWVDYGARMYDGALGRMTKIDGAAEYFDDVSPFQYGLNNPLIHIDPSGDTTVPVNELDMSTFDPKKDDVQLNEVTVKGKRNNDSQQATTVYVPIPMFNIPQVQPLPPVIGRAGAIGGAFWVGWQMGPAVARNHEKQVEGIAQLLEWFGTPSKFLRGPNIKAYIPAPRDLPGFPGTQRAKPKSGRARWTTPDGDILEWDSQHGEVEVYNKRGKHKGVADPNTGEIIKPEVPGRTTEI